MQNETGSLLRAIEAARAAERTGSWDEALARYEEAFRLLPSQGDAAAAADLLRWIARVHRERGDVEVALEAVEASLAIAQANGLSEQTAHALNSLGIAEQFRGRLDEAEPLYVQARAVAEEAGLTRIAAMAEQNLATLSNIRGEIGLALSCYRLALSRYRGLGDERSAAHTLNNMGMAHVDVEAWAEAETCFAEAERGALRAGDALLAGKVELNRAELYLKRQQYEQARECCDRALETFRPMRSKLWVAEAYKFYGVLYRDTGKSELADVHFGLALGLAEASQDPLLQAESLSEWAVAHLESGHYREALQRFNRAHRLFRDLRARRELWDIERRLEELRGTYLAAARSWAAEIVERRDPYLSGQVERVAGYSAALAEAVGLRGWDLTWLRVGAYLHDVGTTAVPDAVLLKPDRLTPEEREIMQSHTVLGDALISEMEFPEEIRPVVRNHHERWDGGGYPDRLRGEQIPLAARILKVADVYDAMTTPRRYRAALSGAAALATMRADAGRALDPTLFDAFAGLVRDGAFGPVAV